MAKIAPLMPMAGASPKPLLARLAATAPRDEQSEKARVADDANEGLRPKKRNAKKLSKKCNKPPCKNGANKK